MSRVYKTFLLGMLAAGALGAITALAANALNVSGEVGGIAFVVGAGLSGLIGGAVSRRMPPPQRRH